jgi:hypothetical protein
MHLLSDWYLCNLVLPGVYAVIIGQYGSLLMHNLYLFHPCEGQLRKHGLIPIATPTQLTPPIIADAEQPPLVSQHVRETTPTREALDVRRRGGDRILATPLVDAAGYAHRVGLGLAHAQGHTLTDAVVPGCP